MSAFRSAAVLAWSGGAPTADPTVTWQHVVDEIVWSCARRAPAGALFRRPGVVGMLAGPAQEMWVYSDASTADVLEILDRSPAVNNIYVAVRAPGLIGRIVDNGWQLGERVDQFVHGTGQLVDVSDAALRIRPLGPIDGPVEVIAAYDDDGALIGSVGRRDQHRSAMLFGLGVAPEWRNRGVGCALVRTAMDRARGAGADFVHAQAGLAGGVVFDRCGFSAVGGWQPLSRSTEGH
jgi:ribosomal protein S18 acetylase RimI-like enzyme